jgi:hypothetical protein
MAATQLQTNSACASHCANPLWRMLQPRPTPEMSSHRCVVDGGCALPHWLGSALPRSHRDVRKGDGGALLQRGHGAWSPTLQTA